VAEGRLTTFGVRPSMRAKIIHCDLHDYAVESRTLDSGLASFKSEYCDNCKDISARLPDWKYSEEWQQEENQRHREFLATFYQRRERTRE
jgi:hypothetical protein